MTRSSSGIKGVEVKTLCPGSLIDVETRSRHYRIESLGGNEIRISGHPDYCPRPELAQVYGAIDDEGEVEFGLIEPGMRLPFFLGDRPVTTSKIVSVHVG